MIAVITYNCHLGVPFNLFDEKARRQRICELILQSNAPLVCLCEVWLDDDKKYIIDQLSDEYPYYYFQALGMFKIAEGLLVISKFPLYNNGFLEFREGAGTDNLAQKGVFTISALVNRKQSFRFFFTHTQSGESHSEERIDNLKEIAQLVTTYYPEAPAIILGDLNIAAHNKDEYEQMLDIFSSFTDSYAALHPNQPGFTLDTTNNKLAQRWDAGEPDQRLDYILPTTTEWEIDQVTVINNWKLGDGLDCSDHYPLQASLSLKKSYVIPFDQVYDTYEAAKAGVDKMKADYGDGVSTLIIIENASNEELSFVRDVTWYGSFQQSPAPIIAAGKFAAVFHHHPNGEAEGSIGAMIFRIGDHLSDIFCGFSTPWGLHQNTSLVQIRKSGYWWKERSREQMYELLWDADYNSSDQGAGFVLNSSIAKGTSPYSVFKITDQSSTKDDYT